MAWLNKTAHEIAYFRLGGVRQAFSIDSTQLLKPTFYGDSSDIPDAHATPVHSYPPLEKLSVHNSRRVGVPVSFIRELSLDQRTPPLCCSWSGEREDRNLQRSFCRYGSCFVAWQALNF